ncbi:MAG: hypothetical protein M3044_01115 [Thermoproteota archaeon]|nr:hypothetical protein [Thermoproteota archaeon]
MRFLGTTDTNARKNAFDVLAIYGSNGEATITEPLGSTINDEVKAYGFEVIKRMKQSTKP